MRSRYDEIVAAGGSVVAIGMGQVPMAAHFRDEQEIPFPLIVDRTKQTYRALEIQKGGIASVMGPTVWLKAAMNMFKGHRPVKKPKQDPFQLGATAIVKAGGEISHLHRAGDSSDNYPVDDVIEELRKL